jgi:hypothetical protein
LWVFQEALQSGNNFGFHSMALSKSGR